VNQGAGQKTQLIRPIRYRVLVEYYKHRETSRNDNVIVRRLFTLRAFSACAMKNEVTGKPC